MKKTAWMGLAASLLNSSGAYAADRFVGMGVGSATIDDSANFNGSQMSVDMTISAGSSTVVRLSRRTSASRPAGTISAT